MDDGREGRSSRILGGGSPARNATIATVSTVVVFGAIVALVVTSAGWPEVKQQFFNWDEFTYAFPKVLDHLRLNIEIFLVGEAVILVLALGIAILRGLPGPVFFPLRLLATIYTDFFRGGPTILVICLLGFGVPALQLSGVPSSELFWGTTALTLVYSAYVAEVYRAGIASVPPSQDAAA